MINQIFIFFKKELRLLKGDIFTFILLSFLLPLFLYLFFSIPLSFVFINIKPIYKVWSLPGLCFISTIFLIFIVLYPNIKEKINSEFLFTVPISSSNILISIYLFSFMLSFFQFSLSFLLINSLNNQYIQVLDFLLMYVIIFPSIVFFTSFIIISAVYVESKIMKQFLLLFIFIFTSFGLGAFFPLDYFPEKYLLLFKYFPLSCSILNIQKINAAESIYFSYYIISIVYSILITVVTYIVFQNRIKGRLY